MAYIEREAAIELMSQPITMSLCLSVDECHHKIAQQRIDRYLIENIPAADVRPVVLCRDCKHNMANIPDIQDGININKNWNACQLTELYDSVKPDDFCSRGVKREES